MQYQIDHHLSLNSLYYNCNFQSAYRAQHSTETALTRVHNDIMLALDKKHDVILVLLDLSAAFETIDHEVLLHRLEYRFGFTDTVLNWFRSYLSNRMQYVSVACNVSNKSVLTCGVPQGTVLGPSLFTLYTAPLEDILVKYGLNFMLFADDTQVYISCKDVDAGRSRIETCIVEIRQWMHNNMLVLNDSKTEVIHFKSKFCNDLSRLESLRIGASDILPSSYVRNLGVFFNQNGLMDFNIKQMSKSASYSLWKIGRIRHLLTQSLTERLIHAFITSRIDYCNALLIALPYPTIRPLQTIQNSAARMITRTPSHMHDMNPILQQLHWLPISHRIKFKILLLTFKCQHSLAPLYLSELISWYQPSRPLRSGNQFRVCTPSPKNKLWYGPTAFSIAAPPLWNSLPLHIRMIDDINTFKSNIKTFLFQDYYRV